MIDDNAKEDFRQKVRKELEEAEKQRQESKTESAAIPLQKPVIASNSDKVVSQDSGKIQTDKFRPLPDAAAGEEWIEIEKFRRQVEEEWFSHHPEYVQYTDRRGNKTWMHKSVYDKKKSQDIARRAHSSRRKKISTRNTVLGIVITVAAIFLVTKFLVPRYNCAVLVKSNIEGAAIFIDGKRTNYDTDALITTLSPGSHQFSIYKPGYTTGFKEVEIMESDTVEVEISLSVDLRYSVLAEKRTGGANSDDDGRKPIYTPGSAPKSPVIAEREKVTMVIATNISDVVIKIDSKPSPYEVNRLIDSVEPGSHIIELEKSGYRSEPAYAVVNLQKGAATQYLSFEMVRESPLVLTIRTEPVDGDIFIDNILMGHGECIREYQIAGRFNLSFGKVRGYRSPDDIAVQISEREPSVTAVGRYLPIIDISMSLGQNGQLVKNKVREVNTGYYYPNTGPVPSEEYGPDLHKLPVYNINVYEMGFAFARRNPPGNDFVEVVFDLPENFEKNKILYLTLRGLASNKNYLFNLTKMTDIAVEINGKGIASHHTPINNLDRDEPMGNDTWPISDFLNIGENRIIIRTTEDNKCYYYLHSIEIK